MALGKTPPRLLQDLALYNPQRLPTSGFNVFVQSAVQFLEAGPAPKLTARNACRHIWILKPNQSVLPTIDEKPTTSSVYTVSACCSDCRSHINITIDFRGESSITFPCPKEGTPLHHFLYRNTPESGLYQRKDDIGLDIWLDERHFECSNPSCSARLTTRIRSPRLVLEWIDLLTNPALVRARAQDVMAKDPERFEGHAVPPIVQVLANLRAYLANALTSPEPRRILGNNKKFLLCLGEPCADLLQYLGFTRTVG
jgi:ubiquitin carboxyl-terminal hydrolase 25/28